MALYSYVSDNRTMDPIDSVKPALGDSKIQRDAEPIMVALLAAELGISLQRATISLDGRHVQVDAADEDRTVLVEAWAHQGRPKGAQRNKVLTDAFKLTWVRSRLRTTPRLILLLSDVAAARPFTSDRSWYAAALADLAVEIKVVKIPMNVREAIEKAQIEQFR